MKSLRDRAIQEEMDIPVPIPTADGCGISETITVRVTGLRNQKTGEVFLDGDALDAIDRAKSRHLGLLSSEDIRGLRAQLRLTQEDMSRLLKIGEKTYTRWESGRSRPSQAMNLLLLGLRDGVIPTGWLQTVQKNQFRWTPSKVSVIWSGYCSYSLQGVGVSPPSCTGYVLLSRSAEAPPPFNFKTDSIKRNALYEEFAATA